MAEFVINSFALLDLLQKIMSTSGKKLCQQALEKYATRPTCSCLSNHMLLDLQCSYDRLRKDAVKDFKRRQSLRTK